jgi:transcription elongation factor Elf1
MARTIDDSKVVNVWVCPDCNAEASVNPDYYQDNGTPVCGECDLDMDYSHTEIND